MIHVALGINAPFAKFAAVTMASIFENTKSDVTVHILHDNTFTEKAP